MCAPGDPCSWLTFNELRDLTYAVTRTPCWTGRAVYVTIERRANAYGSVNGRVVRYAPDGAPACVVIHELAHLGTPGSDHGPAWQNAAHTLWTCLQRLR